MEMCRKITIITVCLNVAADLERTIKSIESQMFKDYEYIIIDGGSSDNSQALISKYSNCISNFISEPDNGIYDAMNKGVKMASGEWLIMMNAGDVFADENVLSNVFSEQIPDNISFLYSDIYGLRSNGKRILRPLSFEKGNLIHQAIIYRRNLHQEHGYYIVTKKLIISDYLFFLRIPQDQVSKIDTVIAVYQGGGISAQGGWARQQAYCADVVFRRRTFVGMLRAYFWKKVKAIIPVEIKDIVKKYLVIGR